MHRTPTETPRLDKREAGDLAQAGFLDRLFEELAKLPGDLTELRKPQLGCISDRSFTEFEFIFYPQSAVKISQVMHQLQRGPGFIRDEHFPHGDLRVPHHPV